MTDGWTRLACGAVAGLLTAMVAGTVGMAFVRTVMISDVAVFAGIGAITGLLLSAVVSYRPGALAPVVATGLVLSVLEWLFWYLTVAPLLTGRMPTWSAAAAGGNFAVLVAGLLHGGLTGALLQGLLAGLARQSSAGAHAAVGRRDRVRVVIVGGGFGGMATARRLERFVARGQPIEVTLISDSNFLLFTPMLAGAASGAVQVSHISAPARAVCLHTTFRRGRVLAVDPARRTVRVTTARGGVEDVGYDHLVVATGAAPHFLGLPGVQARAFPLKTL
ncbi:MAG: FAD-dependent oxidoreductase, partial [Kutzneria sp.]|nr:FAD-dependent oxidoreductase [Kutzneria sp.]